MATRRNWLCPCHLVPRPIMSALWWNSWATIITKDARAMAGNAVVTVQTPLPGSRRTQSWRHNHYVCRETNANMNTVVAHFKTDPIMAQFTLMASENHQPGRQISATIHGISRIRNRSANNLRGKCHCLHSRVINIKLAVLFHVATRLRTIPLACSWGRKTCMTYRKSYKP
jgi:hypothetical protein